MPAAYVHKGIPYIGGGANIDDSSISTDSLWSSSKISESLSEKVDSDGGVIDDTRITHRYFAKGANIYLDTDSIVYVSVSGGGEITIDGVTSGVSERFMTMGSQAVRFIPPVADNYIFDASGNKIPQIDVLEKTVDRIDDLELYATNTDAKVGLRESASSVEGYSAFDKISTLNSKLLKSKVFTETSNSGGGVNVAGATGINQSKFVSVRSSTANLWLSDIGNGYALVIDTNLQKKTNTSVSGILYYID